ncbi:MAG TPA: ATP-binding protein [Gemmatimonadales bacterium]|nr:ATP-binding protein [Gemmatimonadales bacterium]
MTDALRTVAEFARELAGVADAPTVVARLASRLQTTFAPDACAVALTRGDYEAGTPLHAEPPPGERFRNFLTLALRRGSQHLSAAEAEGRLGLAAGDAPAPDLLIVPITTASDRLGALLVGGVGARWTSADLALAEALAAQAGAALAAIGRIPAAEAWERVADALSIALCIVDGRGRVKGANRSFARLMRSTPAELPGWPWLSLVPPAWAMSLRELFDESNDGRREAELKASGRTLLATAFPLPGGTSGEHVLVLDDQTERRRLQDQLVQSEKLSAIGQLIAGVAHELNNPLTSVVGFADFLAEAPDVPAGLREPLSVIQQEATRASTLVRNLLRFARRHEPERRRQPLRPILEGTLALLRAQFVASGIEIHVTGEPGIPDVNVDAPRVQQIFLNLINNAAQSIGTTGRPGTITIRLRPWLDGAAVDVRDDGPGMTAEVAAQAFEPFFSTKPEGQGTGLGLAISQGIAKEHGGRISLTTAPGAGATFTVEFPGDGRPVAEEPAEPVVHATAGPRRILVIDDEPHILHYMRATLESWGHSVDTADDGARGLERARATEPDLIITDLRMPRMSGREFFESLAVVRPDLAARVAFSTGDTIRGDTLAFLERQGRPVLHKPFSLSELRRLISVAAA